MSPKFLNDRPFGAALASCAGLALSLGASAEVGDLSLFDDARVSGKFDQRLGEELRGTKSTGAREGLELSVLASVAYDDNIFRSKDDAQEDLVTSIAPTVRYTLGQPEGRMMINATYQSAAHLYLDHSDESRVDHHLDVEAVMRRKMLRLAYSGSWARLGNPDPDVGGSPDRWEWDHRIAVGWEPPGKKTSGEIFADWSVVDQDSSSLNDVEETTIGINILHRYSSKTHLGVSYEIGEVDVDASPKQDLQRLMGLIKWQPRQKISISFEGGGEYREYGDGKTNWEPVFSGRLSWASRHGTEFYFAGYRRQEASAYFDEQNFTALGMVGGWSQRIYGDWSGRLEMGWEEADYFSTGSGGASRDDTAFFVRPTMSYLTESGHALQFFYQWSDSDSSDSDFGYSNHELGASLDCQF